MMKNRKIISPLLTITLWLAFTSSTPPASPAPLPLINNSGTQVSVNGRNLPAAWSQWQLSALTGRVRTGISDAAVMQRLGVELLNTRDAAKQPVKWFFQPTTTPLVLNSLLVGSYRYLDVTQLAHLAGWQLSTDGNTLRITMPVARVKAIRQGQQSWGERIVFDLDRPTPWQVGEVGSRGAGEQGSRGAGEQGSRG